MIFHKSDSFFIEYCGPSALRILLGKTAEYWENEILEYRKTHIPANFTVRELADASWVVNGEVQAMMRRVFPEVRFNYLKKRITAHAFSKKVDPAKTYLLSLTNHLVVLQNDMIFDNAQFYQDTSFFRYKQDVVEAYMELDGYRIYKQKGLTYI